ncbi:glycosyl transferase [Sphaerimonospora thailandensis]|uniref:Glycosyl transferase n=2 Tax=Sphaerimonospora thailandensis TaxID=795644 RepID=A0A8J3R7E7_9ACTN|nr:glycosyl transferase [Sphaerimonospora thailandensis]
MEHPAALAGPPIGWRDLDRVLVVRPDNLGDVLMAGPALRALRHAAPGARLDLLAAPAGAAAALLLPEIDAVLTCSVSWQEAGSRDVPVAADLDLVDRIGHGGYQAVVILTSFSQSPWPAGYLCRLAGVPVRVGMSKEFGGAGLTHWVPSPPDELHQVDRSLHLLERVAVPPFGGRLHARVPPGAVRAARVLLGDRGPYALILPGASCPARRYPAGRFARVAGRLASSGLRVVVAGTAKEAPVVAEAAGDVPGAVILAGELDVPALAATVAGARVVVCNNSGGAHLAAALGTPVVVLFAGTEQVGQYLPRFVPASVLTVPTGCAPCRQFTCPYALECLDLPPERVAAEAVRLAARGPVRTSAWSSVREPG